MNLPRRNDPCPCGSGLKFKKCCMLKSGNSDLYSQDFQKIYTQAIKKLSELEWDQALNLFKSLNDSGQNSYAVLEGLAACYDGLEDYLRAAEFCEKALNVSPDHHKPKMLYRLGIARACANRYDKALAAFNECLEVTPDEGNRLHVTHIVETLNAIVQGEKDPSLFFVQVQLQKAFTDMEADRHESAAGRLTAALEKDPENPVILYNLGVVYTFLKEEDRALDCFQRAVTINPLYAEAWYNMGQICLLRKKDFSRALHCFEQASTARPDYVGAQHQQGTAWELLGDSKKAVECWEKALALDPENVHAKRNIERLKAAPVPQS